MIEPRVIGNSVVMPACMITANIPGAKTAMIGGEHYVALPHTVDTIQLLKNMGKELSSPILKGYTWPGKFKPYDHQRKTSEFFTLNRRCFCTSGMGSMKTLASLWAADYLLQMGAIRKCLVVATLSTLERVWGDEIFRNFPHRSFAVLHGSRQKRLELLGQQHDFYIINHDGTDIIKDAVPDDVDLVIIDEVAGFRNHKSRKWANLKRIVKDKPWVWGMTGTPTPNAPTDAYGQMKLVCPDNYNGSFTRFKMETMRQITQFKWVSRNGSEETVAKLLSPCIRYELRDCVDLPETIYHEREAPLSDQQKKHLKEFERECVTEIGDKQITAVNAAVLISKIVQLSCIVEDTPVLTHIGWIPIQDITLDHKIWDGVEWITSHKGVVYKGEQYVVECGGVGVTNDHKMYTTQGWKTAKEINNDKRLNWPKIRLPNCVEERHYSERGPWDWGFLGLPLRLRKRSNSVRTTTPSEVPAKSTALWLSQRQTDNYTRNELFSTVQNMESNESKMSQPCIKGLYKIRRKRDNSLSTLVGFVCEFLGRYGRWVFSNFNTRENRQQQRIFPRQLQMGDYSSTSQQQEDNGIFRYPRRQNDSCTSGETLRNKKRHSASKDQTIRVDSIESTDYSRRKVYDIIGCGERQQFVVKGRNGELRIVHNCGCVYSADRERVEIDFGPRYNVLVEAIEEADSKIIIFVPFTSVLDMLADKLRKHWTVEVVDGGVSSGKRNKIFSDFQNEKNPHIIVAHPGTMSHGLTLTAADTIIWYAPTWSAEQFYQANARIARPGQKLTTNIVHIFATPTERRVYQVLKDKGRIQDAVLELTKGANN